MVRGVDQLVFLAELQDFVHLAGEDQAVAAEDELIRRNGRDNLPVQADNLHDVSAVHAVQSALAQRLSHQVGHGGYHKFYRVRGRVALQDVLRRAAVGQKALHRDEREHADGQAEQSDERRGEDV